MITRLDIEERVREWGLREDVVEKDYVIGWVLWGIGADETLSTAWAFKGGTSLKKCYLETYRFSEDLDFTVLPGGPIRAEELSPILQRVLERVHEQSGIVFTDRPPLLKTRVSGNYTQGRVYFRGPRNTPGVASLILDLSASEKVARPTVLQQVAHAYPDKLPTPGTVRCYTFDEVFAEKIRAMGERSRPRDLYHIINLFRRDDLRSQPEVIRQVLVEKCASKGVPVPTFAALESSPHRPDLENEWGNMLAHQLQELPPFGNFWEELPALFDWLEGRLVREELASVPQQGEETNDSWKPPATVWTWGEGVPVESLRFAAANHLCVDLGYGNSVRRIEPYAFRRTKAGKVLLCAIKVQSRESRTMSNPAPQLVQKLWNYCNILRDDGLSYGDYVEQFIFWLKDDALEESANLPAPEIIAADIAADLEAALEQFATIAEDLKRSNRDSRRSMGAARCHAVLSRSRGEGGVDEP